VGYFFLVCERKGSCLLIPGRTDSRMSGPARAPPPSVGAPLVPWEREPASALIGESSMATRGHQFPPEFPPWLAPPQPSVSPTDSLFMQPCLAHGSQQGPDS
jgi:hypothetical protein